MWRIGRALAALAVGCSLLFAPVAVGGASAATTAAPAQVQPTDQAPPGPDLQPPGSNQPQGELTERQRLTIGTTGVVLIVLVLLSRKLRNKPVFGFKWKKEGGG